MSIQINNFSFEEGNWEIISDFDSFYADVTDTVYGVVTSGTYFKHNGDIVPTTYSGIVNGYRLFYTPTDLTSSGTITITVRAENTNSDIVESDYYFLYGYNVRFNELVDWGINNSVDVVVKVNNEVLCPNTASDGFYFSTADLVSRDLNASINAVEFKNLNASLFPQNTFFYYGRTYTIKIQNIRDYADNEMPEFSFSFTIEDPTN